MRCNWLGNNQKNILLSDENNARNIYNILLVSSFVYNQALLAFISRRLWCSIRYLTLAFCSRLFCHTIHNSLQFGIMDGFRDSRNYGFTEIELRFATPDYKTTSSAAATCSLVVLWTSSLRNDSEAHFLYLLYPLYQKYYNITTTLQKE